MHVHWHRRDLRVADNRALSRGSPVLPVFVFDGAVLSHAASPRVSFMLSALESLRESYRERGGDLLVLRGDPREEIPRIAAAADADRVVWNRDYSGLAKERDADVRDALSDAGIERRAFHDALLHTPGSITTNQGDYYSVYTYFWKKWRDRAKDAPFDAPDEIVVPDEVVEEGIEIPTLADLGFEDPEAEIPPAGTEAARDLLSAFCEDDVYRYDEARDYPARESTSRLSPHLKFGTVGIREVWEATERAKDDAESEDAAESVEEFQGQLAWREFYAHVLDDTPSVVVENYKDYQYDIAWRDDPDGVRAWKDGETGYPIVDAGMRQLREEAWVHNRVRMIIASFLTKDLLVDWREGYDWYRRKLVDHDTANDNGGWQWAASTGTDAQPYFRIFNPTTQGERFDPDAEYIKRFVPELADVPPKTVHEWTELDPDERRELAPDYPDPIVDHSERREMAITMFENARG
ncbi:deoxyribodipyrimidine photolyase [Haladaptatus sp. W1]|uniref:cryptochrome/photolyase family protein n=1 Tax=Haladaptatus sp. W1 TaxID=1897478 RepID=UPI000849D5D6|nr:deoxyribodipyrimidine photo-lyase [Haladaptatus sp. W1]ODR80766.1 deoxyribodipyrimidine photolyase [Haladaptatus sp. W1]